MTTIVLLIVAALVTSVAFALAVTAWGLVAFLGTIVYLLVGTPLALWVLGIDPRELLR